MKKYLLFLFLITQFIPLVIHAEIVLIPTCSISFSPQVVKVGESVTETYKTTGIITSISQKGTGDLSWKGFGGKIVDSSTPFIISLNTGNYSQKIKTSTIGTATETATVTGPGGSSTCTGTYKVISKSTSISPSGNTTPKETIKNENIKQGAIPGVSENQPSNGKTIFINNKIIYLVVALFVVLALFIISRFLKSKGIIKIPSIKRKWFILALVGLIGVAGVSSAGYFGVKQYQEYQAEKKMLPIVLQVQELVKQGKNDEVSNLVKDFTEEDKRVFKNILNKEKINLAVEAEQFKKEKEDQEAQRQKDMEVDKLKQEVEALKNTKPLVVKPEIVGPQPQNNNQQATSDLAKFIVRIICSDGSSQNVVGGSGTIFGLNKFIITNFHVVERSVLCKVGITDDIKNPPTRWYDTTIATPIPELDIALLKPTQTLPDNVSTVAYNLCDSSDIKLGDEITVLGYPGVGGNTITATEGVISGFEGYRVKTSAKIEHGNSGGGAFLKKNGCWFGIPTSVAVGEVESLGSIINYSFLHEQSQ